MFLKHVCTRLFLVLGMNKKMLIEKQTNKSNTMFHPLEEPEVLHTKLENIFTIKLLYF